MTELSAVTAGIASKIAGMSVGALLAAVVVMAITPAKNAKEFIVGMISTLVASLSGGAAIIKYFQLTDLANDIFGIATIGGIMFIAGLPGWLLVRAFFLWAQRRKHLDIAELLKDARRSYKGEDNE